MAITGDHGAAAEPFQLIAQDRLVDGIVLGHQHLQVEAPWCRQAAFGTGRQWLTAGGRQCDHDRIEPMQAHLPCAGQQPRSHTAFAAGDHMWATASVRQGSIQYHIEQDGGRCLTSCTLLPVHVRMRATLLQALAQ